jgi:hypothetical protein
MRIERLLRASGFEPTCELRRLLKKVVGGSNRCYRWVLVGPSMFLRWSRDLVEPAFVLGVAFDPESYDGLDVLLSVRDPRTFDEIQAIGYDGSGDKF